MGPKYNNVLVLGGTGFIGKNLRALKPEWDYAGTDGGYYDFTELCDVLAVIRAYEPDAIINLASRVGGIKDNATNQLEFYEQNIVMNTNILKAARILQVPRVLSALSTCAWPNSTRSSYTLMSETDLFQSGQDVHPFRGHLGYGWTKRMLHLHTKLSRSQGWNYSTFAPSNVYGPYDNFFTDSGHFVSALISKVYSSDGSIRLWGTGQALRQYIYVEDLCEIIVSLLDNHNSDIPVLVAPAENLSIAAMAEILIKNLDKNITVEFTGELGGQFRKDCSNHGLTRIIGEYDFTTFEAGVVKTYNWFLENK